MYQRVKSVRPRVRQGKPAKVPCGSLPPGAAPAANDFRITGRRPPGSVELGVIAGVSRDLPAPDFDPAPAFGATASPAAAHGCNLRSIFRARLRWFRILLYSKIRLQAAICLARRFSGSWWGRRRGAAGAAVPRAASRSSASVMTQPPRQRNCPGPGGGQRSGTFPFCARCRRSFRT